MPHESMTTMIVACFFGFLGYDLAFGEVENVLLWLSEEPLGTCLDVTNTMLV
jgi:hypothetical protein